MRLRRWLTCVAACAATAAPVTAHAGVSRYCDDAPLSSARDQDRLFRFAAVIKAELEASGQGVAVVSRSGIDLSRFDQRYSHAGFALRHSRHGPWAVRQLYYECGAQQSRLFDQGLTAFLLGAGDPRRGFISVVMLPASASDAVERVALDNAQALRMLSPHYSANAHAFSVMFQNCNQWVAELLASALGELDGAVPPRQAAQTWLQQRDFEPTVFDVGWGVLMWLSRLSPWLHQDDHPAADLADNRYRVSMPASIEQFVQHQLSGAQRVEFCHTDTQIVVRRGWRALSADCQPDAGDSVLALD